MVATNYELTQAQEAASSNLNSNITHIAVGDGVTTPDVTDTTLTNETYRAAIFAKSLIANTVNADIKMDVTQNNGNDIEEIGALDASSGGNLYLHSLSTSFIKTADKEAYYRLKTTYVAVNN